MMKILKKITAHNWLSSIYLNFKMLPFNQAIYLPLDCYGNVRFEKLSGKIILKTTQVYRGMIKIGSQGSDMFPRGESVLSIEGTVIFRGKCALGSSSILVVKKHGLIDFGHNVILGAKCLVFSESSIIFKNDVLTSWNCQFLDSDTHKIFNSLTKIQYVTTKPIIIGSHTWVGNHVLFNKGAIVTNDTIIASNSFVNKDFSFSESFCLLAGSPAKVVKNNISWQI